MMNFANDIDVYQIWANMVAYNQGYFDVQSRPYNCVYMQLEEIIIDMFIVRRKP